jgi:3-(3-hydroxy-phenyl)propionate hydroxylase
MFDDKRIAIVGGGPVGLTTALTLSRRGVPCVVYEAAGEIAKEQRGAAFHPPTLEIFRHLGIESSLMKMGLRVPIWQMRDRMDGVYAEFDLGTLAEITDFPFRYHLPQHYLSSLLLDTLKDDPNVELRFSSTVTSVKNEDKAAGLTIATADGERIVRSPWVVGSDGAHSEVRKSAGFDFEGFTWKEKFLVTNVEYPLQELGYTGTAYVSDPEDWAAVLKLYDDTREHLWRIAMPAKLDVSDDSLLQAESVQARLRKTLGVDMEYPVAYSGTYRVHQRVADTFFKGRILLAGDAAHINNPIGGFGLNGGIHDAFNLANKLADVWLGISGEEALELYSRQRRTVAVEVVQKNSIRNKQAMEERDPDVRRRNKDAMRALSRDPVKVREFLLDSSMISSVRRAAEIS